MYRRVHCRGYRLERSVYRHCRSRLAATIGVDWKSWSSSSSTSTGSLHTTIRTQSHATSASQPQPQSHSPPPPAPQSPPALSTPSGAWTLLAALEKSIEAQGVHVARLVSSFEVLLPRPNDFDLPPPDAPTAIMQGELHQTECEHSNDPAFFSFLPHMNSAPVLIQNAAMSSSSPMIQRQHIVEMLYATRHGRRIALSTIQALLQAATWQNQQRNGNIVTLPPLQQQQDARRNKRVTVVGDLHGSLSDLEAVLALVGEPSEDHVLVFNGDLADRGEHGIEVIAIVCALLLAYPQHKVIVNRGNHEDVALSIAYGLALEVRHKYGAQTFSKTLAPLLDAFFRSLPLATVIPGDALIVHAGPPPPGVRLQDIADMDMEQNADKNGGGGGYSRTVRSFTVTNNKQPNGGSSSSSVLDRDLIVEALLWSDPMLDDVTGTLKDNRQHGEMWKTNKSRGAGFKFDSNIVRNLLRQEGLFRLIRSHEPVKNGCVRYTINSRGGENEYAVQEDTEAGQFQELFTLFSASRYPNKEGFNKGAILTLLPHGQHRIVRYDTENDDPVMELSKILTTTAREEELTSESSSQDDQVVEECGVDSIALRRALSEAIASHRSHLERSLEQVAAAKSLKVNQLAFHDAVDTLFDVLHLEGEGLCQYGPRLALANALSSRQCDHISVLPESIDIIHALDECLAEQDMTVYSSHLNWLHSIFSLVDADHNGQISKAEWKAAVAKINATLPKGTSSRNGSIIDADETWALLDLDEDGYVSTDNWDAVLLDVSLTSK